MSVTPRREPESQSKAIIIAKAALEKHAEAVAILDLRTLSSVTDFFVVCTAGSNRQLDAIRDHVETVLEQYGARIWHVEGSATPVVGPSALPQLLQWVLMDCGDVVVHVLDQQARAFYRLEELWADAPRVAISTSSIPTPSLSPPAAS